MSGHHTLGANHRSHAGTPLGYSERPVVFSSGSNELVGMCCMPEAGARSLPVGVLVVVGGPQYRVGSHRQFVLLARHLAGQGVTSLRFDYHGLGDSGGPPALGVDGLDQDLRSAVDTLLTSAPDLSGVVLWGLCGAASASALYAPIDNRIRGMVMLNPWVRTEAGLAQARLKYYYLGRLADKEFWARLLKGDVALVSALGALWRSARQALGAPARSGAADGLQAESKRQTHHVTDPAAAKAPDPYDNLPERMLKGLMHRTLPSLVVLSGDSDMTANEFRNLRRQHRGWRKWAASSHVTVHEVAGSNHTFSRSEWRDNVAQATAHFVHSLRS